jgi:hypothetical protein
MPKFMLVANYTRQRNDVSNEALFCGAPPPTSCTRTADPRM